MFQTEVKLAFVERYCNPRDGWQVFVDIDPSEEGRTGGTRKTLEAKTRHPAIIAAADLVRRKFDRLGVTVGGNRDAWYRKNRLPAIEGDRDVIAFHAANRRYLVIEAEGLSSGQPEQKLYKAIGQIVVAASPPPLAGWQRELVLVVHGDGITEHLKRVTVLERLGVSALSIAADFRDDCWIIGKRPALR